LEISVGQRELLESVARSQSGAHREVVRAKALLMASQGAANTAIAQALSVSPASVANWRARFAEDGLTKLGQVRKGRGRKPSIPQGKIDEILELTQNYRPQGQTHWSCRTMAEAVGVSKDTVQRVWSSRGLKPHRIETFKLSNDPRFDEKLVDVVGLYLNPRAPRGTDDLSGGERPSPPVLSQQGR
jgi:transposase